MPIAMALALVGLTPAIVAQAGPHVLIGGPVEKRSIGYGADPRQAVELFTRKAAGRAPVIVYVHGGGWSAGTAKAGAGGIQAEHWTARGYAYASAGYRLVPAAAVEQQLSDLAAGIARLRAQHGVDPDRIVLLGHSSGGHLAALLGTDPTWLTRAGVPFGALKAVILLDPAALEIAPFMNAGGGTIDRYYRPAFGADPARWSALSPIKHTAAPNAPAWGILYDVNNVAAGMQGSELAAGLIAAGVREARVEPVSDTTHLRLNDEIGRPGDRATAVLDAFLGRVFPDRQRARFRGQ